MKIIGQIPKGHFHVACSGGGDSMVLVDFLLKFPRNRFDIIHFNHGTEYCDEAERFVVDFCRERGLELHIGRIGRERRAEESQEEYWRNCRYGFFSGYSSEPIMTAHHLNDEIETWVMTSMSGNPKLIPYRNGKYNIIRPLLCVPKREIEDWISRHGIRHVFDGSNLDNGIRRNYVRNVMMKDVYRISPGIEKIIMKKVMASV